jgi:hypothetical protein
VPGFARQFTWYFPLPGAGPAIAESEDGRLALRFPDAIAGLWWRRAAEQVDFDAGHDGIEHLLTEDAIQISFLNSLKRVLTLAADVD